MVPLPNLAAGVATSVRKNGRTEITANSSGKIYCRYCGLAWDSISSHRRPGSRCGILHRQDLARNAEIRRSKTTSSKRQPKKPQKAKPTSPDNSTEQSNVDVAMDDLVEYESTRSSPSVDHHEIEEGPTITFPVDNPPPPPPPDELPPELIHYPPNPTPPESGDTEPPNDHTPSHRDPEVIRPGCVRTFPAHYMAGQPVSVVDGQPPEQYLTPYEIWHNAWQREHPRVDSTWAPFYTEMEWCLAKWLKESRISEADINTLLDIPMVSTIPMRPRPSPL